MAGSICPIARESLCLLIAVICYGTMWADDVVPSEPVPNSNSTAKLMEKTVQELAGIAKKSVVVVTITGRDGLQQGLGTGFIISENGLIATNLHVIGEARPIQVQLHDGRKFDVTEVHATERSQDLAVLKIDAKDLPILSLGNSDELQDGQPVIAIGNPLGLERSVVSGILSGRREIDGRAMLQIALPIERGNSGGPLLDLQGRVHGLLTLKSLKTENLGFAIAANSLKPLLEKPNPIPMSRWLTIGVIDPAEWTVLPGGRWRQRAGRITVDGRGGGFGGRALCLSTDAVPAVPYEVAVQVKFSPADGAGGLVFHADGEDKHYGFYPTNGRVRLSRFDGPDVLTWKVLREAQSAALKVDGWNSLKVRVEAERFLCYLNGELVFEEHDGTYKDGKVGLCKFRQTEAEFKGFRLGATLVEPSSSDATQKRIAKVIEELTRDDAGMTQASKALAGEDADVIEDLERQAKAMELRAATLRRLATEFHVRRTLTEFESLFKDDSVDLLRAALVIAKLDNSDLDIDGYIREVDRHARHVKESVVDDAGEEVLVTALNRYLFEEQGFHGCRTDYGNRSNSYINEVLDDREGLPITLSVLYIEIAKRLGLNVVGVGLPGHFLARHEPKQGTPQLIDVFDSGRSLTPAQARDLSEERSGATWKDSFLDTYTARATLERILRNLFNAASQSGETERMLRYTEAVLVISPISAQDHFIRGVLSYQTRRWQQARLDVEWLSNHDSTIPRDAIEELARAIDRDSQK